MGRDDDRVLPRVVLSALSVVTGLVAANVAGHGPWLSVAGSPGGTALLLSGGWVPACGALVFGWSRPRRRMADVTLVASSAWFAGHWATPGTGSSLVFTAGLLLSASAPPVVAWAWLAVPVGRPPTATVRSLLATAAAAGVLLAGVVPALLFDPKAAGCLSCPTNSVLINSNPPAASAANSIGLLISGVLLALLTAIGLVRCARMATLRWNGTLPLVMAGACYLSAAGTSQLLGVPRGFIGTGLDQRVLWYVQATALIAFGFGLVWLTHKLRIARVLVARAAVDQAAALRTGTLRDRLAQILGDPALRLSFPTDSGAWVDETGHAAEPPHPSSTTTILARGEVPIAALMHAPGLLGAASVQDEVLGAARLGLEHAAHRAALRSQEIALRTSRRRMIMAADEERRRLERDLHDGAQQRIVGLLLGVRWARGSVDDESAAALILDGVASEIGAAVDGLRALAQGIHPAVLTDEGLVSAIDSLPEIGLGRVRTQWDERHRRLPAEVETAAYLLVREVARANQSSMVTISQGVGGVVTLDVHASVLPAGLVGLEDRICALDGELNVTAQPGEVRLQAAMPCG